MRGALWIVKDSDKIDSLMKSLRSFKKWHGQEYKTALASNLDNPPKGFDYYLKHESVGYFSEMPHTMDLSPFDLTLYMNVDCLVLDDLSLGWKACARHDLALVIAPDSLVLEYSEELIKYSLGVVFFKKTIRMEYLFNKWKDILKEEQCLTQTKGCESDFALAISSTNFNPFVLPNTFNLRMYCHNAKHTIHGPVRIWNSRLPVPDSIFNHNKIKETRFVVAGVDGVSLPELEYSVLEPRQQAILSLLVDTPNPVVAEIGVYDGHTSFHLLSKRPDLRLLMVDAWKSYEGNDGIGGSGQAKFDVTKMVALNRTEKYKSHRTVLAMESTEAAKEIPDHSLDLVFIDANHKYENIKQDILDWWSKIKIGGRICGHDYGTYEKYCSVDRFGPWGVKKAVEEIFGNNFTLHGDSVWCVKKTENNSLFK